LSRPAREKPISGAMSVLSMKVPLSTTRSLRPLLVKPRCESSVVKVTVRRSESPEASRP